MRTWGVSVAGLALAALVAGCADSASDVALATDGPNQVVVKVPSMT